MAAFSVSLACYFLLELQPTLASIGILGGLIVGGICIYQALTLRRRLFDTLESGEEVEGPVVVDEPVAEVSDEADAE